MGGDIMLFIVLLIPLIMLAFGFIWVKYPPGKINSFYGYRTLMSMKNMDTWNFAHHYASIWLIFLGLFLLIVSPVLFLLIRKESQLISLFILIAQMIALYIPIILTERALHKTFDKIGNKRI
jgi:uncharacterized membrane protein